MEPTITSGMWGNPKRLVFRVWSWASSVDISGNLSEMQILRYHPGLLSQSSVSGAQQSGMCTVWDPSA